MNRWTDGIFYALVGLLLALGYTAALQASTALYARHRPALAVALHIVRLGLLAAAMVLVARYSRPGLYITMATFAVIQLLSTYSLRRRDSQPPAQP
jgi:hypothetical protein